MSNKIDDVQERAIALDGRLEADLARLVLPQPDLFAKQLRLYMEEQSRRLGTRQNIARLVRFTESGDESVIELGPTFDKGDSEAHFHFPSGARLSFGVTLRKEGRAGVLVAYRFFLKLPSSGGVDCFLFNLNRKAHPDPFQEPRFHVHPGFTHLRIPVPALSPLDILDRIFLVIEPVFSH